MASLNRADVLRSMIILPNSGAGDDDPEHKK